MKRLEPLLSGERDANHLFGGNQVVDVFGRFADGELHALAEAAALVSELHAHLVLDAINGNWLGPPCGFEDGATSMTWWNCGRTNSRITPDRTGASRAVRPSSRLEILRRAGHTVSTRRDLMNERLGDATSRSRPQR